MFEEYGCMRVLICTVLAIVVKRYSVCVEIEKNRCSFGADVAPQNIGCCCYRPATAGGAMR